MPKHVVMCWICNKVIGTGSSPYGDCGSTDAQHQRARNPPPKRE